MPRPLNKNSCNTCRQRKIKCDASTPACLNCVKGSRYCDRSGRATQFRQWTGAPGEVRPSAAADASAAEDPRHALEDQTIAQLFDHYASNVSKWYDLSDAELNFGVMVPRLALDEPLLFYAIISLSAMHMSKTTTPRLYYIAENYHGHCVRRLITLKESDDLIASGVALAATCLLRSYEILEGEVDPNRHLRGAYSMASQQGLLATDLHSGLLAAGFWNYLREDITFSLIEQCPLKMNLEFVSPTFAYESDQGYMNAISIILGGIINIAFDHSMTAAEWDFCFQRVENWCFTYPKRLEPYSVGNGLPGVVYSLPSVWFLRPCHAAAMHYYLVASIILAVYMPPNRLQHIQRLDFLEGDASHLKEDLVDRWAVYVCAIAFTSKIPSVIVNAFGPIAYCTKYIQSEPSRQELKRQLLSCKSTIGWPVQRFIKDLDSFWS